MYKRISNRYVCLLLLVSVWCLTGCSAEELMTKVPQTMQIEQIPSIETEEKVTEAQSTEEPSIEEQSVEEQTMEEPSFLIEGTRYAYDCLSDAEQIWYQDMEYALGHRLEDINLSEAGLEAGLDEEHIDKIFQCVLNDHPEIFYADGYTYTRYSRGDRTVSISFSGNYQLSMEEAIARKAEIEEAVSEILTGIDMQAADYDKIKYVFDTIIRNTEYDLNAPDNQNIYSVFVGHSSVCQGYAKATQYLLNLLGVECTLVQGTVDNGEGHAWNLVRADGSYYYVDTTWGDASYQLEGGSEAEAYMPEINYDYLCVTTRQLLCTHTLDTPVPMPECIDTAANYYVRQGALFSEYNQEQMSALFTQAYAGGKKDVTVKCTDYDCYQIIKTALIDEQEIFVYLPEDYGAVSFAPNEKQLSLTFWVTNP